MLSSLFTSPMSKLPLLFTTWAQFPLFSQGIKFNISHSLIVTGEGGAETIADNNSKTIQYIFSPRGII